MTAKPRARVRVVCGRCRRKLADLPWYTSPDFSSDRDEHGHGTGGRRWPCNRCGADWQVNRQRWRAAYESAGAGGTITLPV